MELFILSGVIVVLFGTMILHYVERGNLLIKLSVRDERITRIFAENKALENISQELMSRVKNKND
jgi:hypothetical protein